ncbi:MAG: hypothetical protein ACLQU9_03855 [Acidimicrobiales bacterium]|jgi:hypothetical protein
MRPKIPASDPDLLTSELSELLRTIWIDQRIVHSDDGLPVDAVRQRDCGLHRLCVGHDHRGVVLPGWQKFGFGDSPSRGCQVFDP